MFDGGFVPDLLIEDLDMPELSGEDMVRRVLAAWPNQELLYFAGNIGRLDARSMCGRPKRFWTSRSPPAVCSRRSRGC